MTPEHIMLRPSEIKERQPIHDIAIVWNGQTAIDNMGAELIKDSPAARRIYGHASQILEVPTTALTLSEGSNPTTDDVQFANVAYDMAYFEALKEEYPEFAEKITALGGHSFGELMAYYESGAFGTLENFLYFLKGRAPAMQRFNERHPGALFTVFTRRSKTEEEKLEKQEALQDLATVLREKFGIEIATYSSKNRLLFGGATDLVREALQHVGTFRKHLAGQLVNENGAWHVSYVKDLEGEIRNILEELPGGIQDPQIPVVTATLEEPKFVMKAAEVKEAIVRLVAHPVYGTALDQFLRYEQGFDIIQIGEAPIIASNSADDDSEVELEKISHKGRNTAIVGSAAAGALVLGWYVKKKR